jgi:hypothetical protein
MAFAAAHAKACFPFLNCATCASWHWPQVSGVGMRAFAKSSFARCASPWHAAQSTSARACFESFQSSTIRGVICAWQATQACPAPGLGAEAEGFDAGDEVFWASAGAASSAAAAARARRVRFMAPPARVHRASWHGPGPVPCCPARAPGWRTRAGATHRGRLRRAAARRGHHSMETVFTP